MDGYSYLSDQFRAVWRLYEGNRGICALKRDILNEEEVKNRIREFRHCCKAYNGWKSEMNEMIVQHHDRIAERIGGVFLWERQEEKTIYIPLSSS